MKDTFRKPGQQADMPPWPAGVHHDMEYIDGSFVMEWEIDYGYTQIFTSTDCAKAQKHVWQEGIVFIPAYLIYVGAPDMWLDYASVADFSCFGSGPLPLDSFRPGCSHHIINWPPFGPHPPLELTVTNRGKQKGKGAIRFGGKYENRRRL